LLLLFNGYAFDFHAFLSSEGDLATAFRAYYVAARRGCEMGGVELVRRPSLPIFFYSLSARAQQCWLRSDAIDRIEFVPGPAEKIAVRSLLAALEAGALPAIGRSAQAMADELCVSLRLPRVAVEV